MIRKVRKLFFFAGFVILITGVGFVIYNRMSHITVSTLPAKIDEIKQTVKLSALDISTEEIFKDTIGSKGMVSRVRANVNISFDIEHIPMAERGDTLIVQLPPEIIEVYESTEDGYQVLDVWHIRFPDNWVEMPLTPAEENAVKGRIKQRITAQMYEKGYVKRARENAVNSLASLFSKFRDKIIVIDYYPDGWKDNEIPPLFNEKQMMELHD